MKPTTPLPKRLGLSLLAAASLLVTAHLLPATFKRVVVVDDKLATLAAEDVPFDVIFVGTSRIFRHLSPGIFDNRLEKLGYRWRSFNAGIFAMRIVESHALLERIVANPKTRPRWILFEADGFFERIEPENLTNPRTLYWHDLEETFLAARSTLVRSGTDSDLERGLQGARHIQAGAYHALNLGTWSSHLAAWLEAPGAEVAPKIVKRRGFSPLTAREDRLSGAFGDRHQRLLDRFDAYKTQVASYERKMETAEPLTGFAPAMLRRIVETASRNGTQIAFLVSPLPGGRPSVVATIRHERLAPVLDFSNPEVYPELFELENRFDWGHLNVLGARRLSDRLARRFAELLEDQDASS